MHIDTYICSCIACTYIATHLLLLLQIIFAITQNQLVLPEIYVSAHASTLIYLGHNQVRTGFDPDYWLVGHPVILTLFQPWFIYQHLQYLPFSLKHVRTDETIAGPIILLNPPPLSTHKIRIFTKLKIIPNVEVS